LGRAHMLSTMRYHTSVVIYLFAALGTLGSSSRKLMRLSAYADRISDMQSTVKGLASSVGSKLLCLVICWRVFGTGRPLQLIARLQGKTLLC